MNTKMSNQKQTAVEWFLDQLIEHRIIIVNKTTYQVKYKHEILLEQAKEMHKRQIKNAFINGYLDSYNAQNNINADEIFYEKTYGDNK